MAKKAGFSNPRWKNVILMFLFNKITRLPNAHLNISPQMCFVFLRGGKWHFFGGLDKQLEMGESETMFRD
ncbi:hypothetical protein TH8_10120 [Thalassospira profundimaris]|nr:hypothetical protein TH8_10120 [Thalassospira profundimaris]